MTQSQKERPDSTPRPVSDSAVEDHFFDIFPNDLNASETLFGGRLMERGDRLASTLARRHCHWPYVTTVSVDSIRFLAPAYQGETVIMKGSINRVWGSSMEIGIKVLADDFSGGPQRHIFSAFYTFCALSKDRKPIGAPPVVPETPDQKRRFHDAQMRRNRRLEKI